MASDTNSFRPTVNQREAAFARLASRVLEALNQAIEYRRGQGITSKEIADRIGCHKSSLSRTLNGNSPNLTLKTISDILWAADFDPEDFNADPIEEICPNWIPHSENQLVKPAVEYQTKTIEFKEFQKYLKPLITESDNQKVLVS